MGSRKDSSDGTVTISVLDRLVDTDPRNSSEAQLTHAQSVRILKNAVRRDLEWLLNTRRIAVEPDEALVELNRSVYAYGLPDFTAISLSAPKDRQQLIRSLQSVVALFEPRLNSVRIVPLEPEGSNSRTLRFRIEGMLIMDPSPEFVSFDTVLELASSEYRVKES